MPVPHLMDSRIQLTYSLIFSAAEAVLQVHHHRREAQCPLRTTPTRSWIFFGPSNGAAKAPAAAAAAPQGHPVYNKNSMQITMQVSRSAAGAQAQARFKNTGNFERFTNVGLQAAVPKSQKLTLQAINKNVLEGGDEATQNMRIVAATGVSLFHCI